MPPPTTALILSIGDELVSGLTINTNAAWLSTQLTALGIATVAHVTVADQLEDITDAIKIAAAQADLLLISGGLGPTEDDLTRQALADAMDDQLVEDPVAFAELEHWFASRDRPMAPSNRIQAQRPSRASCITNTTGTAPGLAATLGNTSIFVMPGVPREMKEMFTRSILPTLRTTTGDTVTLVSKLNTFGMGESQLGEKIADLMTRGRNPSVGTTVHEGVVSVRIYATGTPDAARAMTTAAAAEVRRRLGALIFGENDTTLEAAVAALLIAKKVTLATAESCTGGLLAQYLTATSGSSAYFLRGWVTYANEAKSEELAIDPALIAKHGAVSEPVARAMATNARHLAKSDYALATTGIAGPTGGSDEKPVGLVYLALATPTETTVRRLIFPGDRFGIRQRAAQMSLALLRWHLMNVPAPI